MELLKKSFSFAMKSLKENVLSWLKAFGYFSLWFIALMFSFGISGGMFYSFYINHSLIWLVGAILFSALAIFLLSRTLPYITIIPQNGLDLAYGKKMRINNNLIGAWPIFKLMIASFAFIYIPIVYIAIQNYALGSFEFQLILNIMSIIVGPFFMMTTIMIADGEESIITMIKKTFSLIKNNINFIALFYIINTVVIFTPMVIVKPTITGLILQQISGIISAIISMIFILMGCYLYAKTKDKVEA